MLQLPNIIANPADMDKATRYGKARVFTDTNPLPGDRVCTIIAYDYKGKLYVHSTTFK